MKKYLITGLAILLPLAITIAFLFFLINFLTEPFTGAVSGLLDKWNFIQQDFAFLSREQIIRYISKLLTLAVLFIVTLGLGMIARWLFIRQILQLSDNLFQRIPLVNTLYRATRDISKALLTPGNTTFKKVVLAPFPNKDSYVLGIVAGPAPTPEDFLTVLVLTTPNPTTGFLLMFKQKDLLFIDMKSEDAVKYIISCGTIIPNPTRSP
jgi:uncharacterized membrane protein